MPCWEVRTISVEFQAKHRDLLDQAISVVGLRVRELGRNRIGLNNGITLDLDKNTAEFQYASQQSDLNRLKQEYSRQVTDRKSVV